MASKPDFIVKVKGFSEKHGTKVGAAWKTKTGGGLNVVLDTGICIGGHEVNITLWPYEEPDERERRIGRGESRDGGERRDRW